MAEQKRSRTQEIEDEARGRRDDGDEAADENQAAAEVEADVEGDPLAAQGYGEEDFSRRDYIIPGVDADDPEPYKWHTGTKRDHGGEDAIEIIDLVKQFGRTQDPERLQPRHPGQHDLDGARAVGHRQVGADQAHRRPALPGLR